MEDEISAFRLAAVASGVTPALVEDEAALQLSAIRQLGFKGVDPLLGDFTRTLGALLGTHRQFCI